MIIIKLLMHLILIVGYILLVLSAFIVFQIKRDYSSLIKHILVDMRRSDYIKQKKIRTCIILDIYILYYYNIYPWL